MAIKLIKKKIPVVKKSNTSNDEGYFNSIGGTALSVGSVKVNTINLAHFAYEVINNTKINLTNNCNLIEEYLTNAENQYISKIIEQTIINLKSLDIIRDIIITNKEKRHLLPNIADGLIDLKHMYNTLGVIGIYETLKTFQNKITYFEDMLNVDLSDFYYIKEDDFNNIYYTEAAEKFVKRIFENLHNTINNFKQEYNIKYSINIEQIPGETAAAKLQKKDKILYPDLVNEDLPLYGNQFIPLGIKTTLEERVRVASLFDSYLNGGSICHINVESPMNKEMAWEKLKWLAKQKLTYFAFTTKINVCENNHAFFSSVCPTCKKPMYTQYARVVGFYVPIQLSGSTERKEEYKLRQWKSFN